MIIYNHIIQFFRIMNASKTGIYHACYTALYNSAFKIEPVTSMPIRHVPKHLLPKKLEQIPESLIPNIPDFREGVLSRLPLHYQKFYMEWKFGEKEPVHYIPREGKFELDKWGLVKPIQNVAIPLETPDAAHNGIWGGECVIKCLKMQSGKYSRYLPPVPKYWVPELKKSVVYSEVLNEYYFTVVTERTLQMIDKHYGLDFYLLETAPQDLNSLLAFRIKKKILTALNEKSYYSSDPDKKQEVFEKYDSLRMPQEEVEWYGLTLKEATHKQLLLEEMRATPVPMRESLRQELIAQLKIEGEVPSNVEVQEDSSIVQKAVSSGKKLLSKSKD